MAYITFDHNRHALVGFVRDRKRASNMMQAELLDLKQQYGPALHLKKAPAGVSTTPFPISVSFTLDAPASAEVYDISSLKVTFRSSANLQLFSLHAMITKTTHVQVIVTIQANADGIDVGKEQGTRPPVATSCTMLIWLFLLNT